MCKRKKWVRGRWSEYDEEKDEERRERREKTKINK